MRETKFRGLNRNSNKWYYGSLLVTRQLGIYHAQIWLLDEDYPVPVDIETTGEWVGLTDKNGREIYEGDILLLGYGDGSWYTGGEIVVKYGLHWVGYDSDAASSGPALGFYFSPYPYDEGNNSEPMGVGESFSWKSPVEVIGNIYETPEPLKQ